MATPSNFTTSPTFVAALDATGQPAATYWRISAATDRWGELSASKFALEENHAAFAKLVTDVSLFQRLLDQMWDAITFLAAKEGELGVLFEVEFESRESMTNMQTNDIKPESLPRFTEVCAELTAHLPALAQEFPMASFAVPIEDVSGLFRPFVWAFVPDGAIADAATRERLGLRLLHLLDTPAVPGRARSTEPAALDDAPRLRLRLPAYADDDGDAPGWCDIEISAVDLADLADAQNLLTLNTSVTSLTLEGAPAEWDRNEEKRMSSSDWVLTRDRYLSVEAYPKHGNAAVRSMSVPYSVVALLFRDRRASPGGFCIRVCGDVVCLAADDDDLDVIAEDLADNAVPTAD